MSILGLDDEQRKRIRELAREAELKRQQMDELERAIKARIKSEIRHFQSGLLARYKVLDLEDDIQNIKRQLANDARGKAQQAADDRITRLHRMTMGTNMTWGSFINSFGFASIFRR